MIYSLKMKNKEIVLGDFSEVFNAIQVLAKAESLFMHGIVVLEKEEKPFSLTRTICDDSKYHYPIRIEYAPIDIAGIAGGGGKVAILLAGQFSTERPKIASV